MARRNILPLSKSISSFWQGFTVHPLSQTLASVWALIRERQTKWTRCLISWSAHFSRWRRPETQSKHVGQFTRSVVHWRRTMASEMEKKVGSRDGDDREQWWRRGIWQQRGDSCTSKKRGQGRPYLEGNASKEYCGQWRNTLWHLTVLRCIKLVSHETLPVTPSMCQGLCCSSLQLSNRWSTVMIAFNRQGT